MSSKNPVRPRTRHGVAVHGAAERHDVRERRVPADLESYRAYVAHVSYCRQCRPYRCPVGAALCRDYLAEVNRPSRDGGAVPGTGCG